MAIGYGEREISEISSKLEVALFIIDLDTGKILFADEKAARDLNLTRNQIQGTIYQELFTQDFMRFYIDLLAHLADKESNTGIYFWTERNLWEQVSVSRILWDDRHAVLLSITNVNDIARREYEYKQLAFYDAVTGLPNERKLEQDIASIAMQEQVELVFFRIDNLFDIYDLYGWAAGDLLLTLIRDWLHDTKLTKTEVYRLGTVFVLLSHENSEDVLVRRAGIFKDRFGKPWMVSGDHEHFSIHCVVSIGMVRGKYIKNEMRNIIMRTLNMNRKGDMPFVIYDEDSDKHIQRIRYLRSKLIDSIYAGMKGFSVRYHPIVDLEKDAWIGSEALCRWKMEDGEQVSPAEFIPIIEQLNLISELDSWVHARAMSDCCAVGLESKEFYLDVNFSPSQGLDESAVQTISETSFSTGFPLKKLILEITESQRMRFNEQTFRAINQMQRSGISLSLDDFGSGFSSLENLIKISAALLKTDKLLVDEIEEDPSRVLLMKTLINLAHDLDMNVVVEGVERETQYQIIKDLGADYIQGYYFSEPLTIEELAKETWRYSDTLDR